MNQLAIVGAGVSGLATAWALRDAPLDITVFEKSRGYSGRAATRRRDGLCYDHGANYFKLHSEEVERIVRHELPSDQLAPIDRDVWTFNAAGTLQEGDAASNAHGKWTYRRGINTIGKLLAADASADVQRQTRVQHLEQQAEGGWVVYATEGAALGTFDGVVLTPPAPQTRQLIHDSTLDDEVRLALLDGLQPASYASQFTIVLGYPRTIERPGDFYALLNADRDHPIAWLSFEEDKPGHVPDGQSVLILQMAPDWTEAHYEASHDALVERAVRLAGDLLRTECTHPAWTDHQRWRYALPTAAADRERLQDAEAAHLFVTGDALIGKGRVNRALEAGLRCAERIQAAMG